MDLFTMLMVGAAALGIVGVLWLFTAVFLRKVVPTNMVHVVQSAGHMTAYGKSSNEGNVYYAWPSWIPHLGVIVSQFPESIFDVSLKDYEAYDQGRLPFMVDVKAFFRIADTLVAARRVATFTQLEEQLTAVLQGAVRRILAIDHLENIMQDRAGLGQKFTTEVDAQLKEWGVQTVKSIEFMDIRDSRDSEVIHNMMAKEKSRIEMESRTTVAENHRKAQVAEIDAKRQVDVQMQDAAQQVGLRQAEQQKMVGIATERANQEVQLEAKVTADRKMDVARVNQVRTAEINREVVTVGAEANKAKAVIDAEAAKTVAIVAANGKKESTVLEAEGNLQRQLKNAQGVEAEGKAEGEAEKAKLMAPVAAQMTLAKEIGENAEYQAYLIRVREVEANQAVGVAYATALDKADVKIIANTGNVPEAVTGLSGLFNSKGGTALGGMISALAQNPDAVKAAEGILAAAKPATGQVKTVGNGRA